MLKRITAVNALLRLLLGISFACTHNTSAVDTCFTRHVSHKPHHAKPFCVAQREGLQPTYYLSVRPINSSFVDWQMHIMTALQQMPHFKLHSTDLAPRTVCSSPGISPQTRSAAGSANLPRLP